MPQGEQNGNASEKHLCLWQPEDFCGYSGHTIELGATFAAVIQSGSTSDPPLRMQKRLDHAGVRLLLRAVMRRAFLKMVGQAPNS